MAEEIENEVESQREERQEEKDRGRYIDKRRDSGE
jgi:hypothetical protein